MLRVPAAPPKAGIIPGKPPDPREAGCSSGIDGTNGESPPTLPLGGVSVGSALAPGNAAAELCDGCKMGAG